MRLLTLFTGGRAEEAGVTLAGKVPYGLYAVGMVTTGPPRTRGCNHRGLEIKPHRQSSTRVLYDT